jgi:hypothetical protein
MKLQSTADTKERVIVNCFACGRPLDQVQMMPRHNPDPRSEEDRCASRPRKYAHLRCMYARGHECAHTAQVNGTGRTFWGEEDAS